MKLSMGINYSGGFKEAVDRVVELEKAGLDQVWIAEAYSYDAISQVGYLAAKTNRVEIGTGIVNVYSRTAALMAMTAAGCDYVSDGRFILGLGASGPQVIEYNCRFGDPECQAVMPLVKGDLAGFCHAGAMGELRGDLLSFDEGWSVCVVLASAGYPETSRSGDRISGLDVADGCRVYHAGTRLNTEGQWETAGGRVLAVVCGAGTREKAVKAAHLAADGIRFDGLQRRRDVGILHFGSENS